MPFAGFAWILRKLTLTDHPAAPVSRAEEVVFHSSTWGRLHIRIFQCARSVMPTVALICSFHTTSTGRWSGAGAAGKTRVLNIRRLPAWILSYSQHKSVYGTYPDYTPSIRDSPEQMVENPAPDRHLSAYLDGGAIGCWLRVEHLPDDFLTFVSQYAAVDVDRERAVRELPRTNAMSYDRNISHWFSEDQILRLYANNPLWAEIERRVYG